MHSQQSRTPETRAFVEIPATQQSADVPALTPTHQRPLEHGAEASAVEQVVRAPSPPDTRVYHTRTIWSLIAFSFLPGVVARAAPELWAGLPAAWHWAAYVCSGVLVVAATILIVKPVDARRP
jgi:hypothetical protein